MDDDILKPEKNGNSRAAQTRIKGKSAGAIGGQRAHDLRIGPQPEYVDRARSHLNRVLIAPQTGTQLRKVCEDRRKLRTTARAMKSSAAVGMIGIITFGHAAQKIFEALTPDQQDAAYRETAEAIATRLNTTLTGLVVHGDESAPHAHFQLPAYDLTGHPISETAKRAALRDLQTITAEVMGRHAPGIERGRSKVDRLKAGATPAEVVNRSVAQLHDELPIEIAEKEARLAELTAKIEKNERLAAAALEKATANEAKADKALKNAALYESRAEKARQERDAEERALSNLQLDRRKEEERLERLREQQAAILAENQRQAELGDRIAQENGLLAEKGRQRVEALTGEVAGLEAKSARLSAVVQEQEAFIADAERIADTHWDRVSAAMDALSHAEAQRKAVEGEAAQIRETALREAQEAAERASEAIREEIEAQLAPKKLVLKPPTVKREGDPAPRKPPERPYRALVAKLLTEARERIQAALQASPEAQDVQAAIAKLERIKERETRAMVERRRELERTAQQVEENKQQGNKLLSGESRLAQWHSFVEVMKDKARSLFGEDEYKRLADAVDEEWKNHPDNLTKPPHKPEPPKPSGHSGGRSR